MISPSPSPQVAGDASPDAGLFLLGMGIFFLLLMGGLIVAAGYATHQERQQKKDLLDYNLKMEAIKSGVSVGSIPPSHETWAAVATSLEFLVKHLPPRQSRWEQMAYFLAQAALVVAALVAVLAYWFPRH